MSDMTPIPSIDDPGVREIQTSGHIFRSKVIDKFAEIERVVARAMAGTPLEPKPDKRPLLGQRLDALRKLVEGGSAAYGDPKKFVSMLDELRPFCDLRSALAHSTLQIINLPSGNLFVFHTIPSTEECDYHALVLTEEQRSAAWTGLARVSNRLIVHLNHCASAAGDAA